MISLTTVGAIMIVHVPVPVTLLVPVSLSLPVFLNKKIDTICDYHL